MNIRRMHVWGLALGQLLRARDAATPLPAVALSRLAQARHIALARLSDQRHTARLAPVLALSSWWSALRMLVLALALLVGVGLSYTWNQHRKAVEFAEIDGSLLSDTLPPAAYLDKGFHAWLDLGAPDDDTEDTEE